MNRLRQDVVISIALALAYAFFWTGIAFPYHPFPGEDLTYLIHSKRTLYIPAFASAVRLMRWLAPMGVTDRNGLLLLMVGSNAIGLLLIYWITRFMTKHRAFPIGAAALFGVSTWSANYLFFANYAPWASCLALGESLCLIVSRREDLQRGRVVVVIVASALSAALFWSSPSAGVFLLPFALLFSLGLAKDQIALYFGLSGAVALAGVPVGGQRLLQHWIANFAASDWPLGLKFYGKLPAVGSLSFFRILFVYSPEITWLFVLFGVFYLIRKRRTLGAETPLLLLALLLCHALAIDLLPFTKLARTHYLVFPLAISLLFVFADEALAMAEAMGSRYRWAFLCGAAYLLLFTCFGQIAFDRELVRCKQSWSDYLDTLAGSTDFYVLRSDPHHYSIERALNFAVREVGSIQEIVPRPNRAIALISGPSGPGSGRSALHASLLHDYLPREAERGVPADAVTLHFPYYAYFPTFLLEEEVSETLYLHGLSPDYRKPRLGITVSLWSGASTPNLPMRLD